MLYMEVFRDNTNISCLLFISIISVEFYDTDNKHNTTELIIEH